MIMVYVVLHPASGEPPRSLGVMRIVNDGTGTPSRGNYKVRALKRDGKRAWREGVVKGFPRKRKIAWYLLYEALKGLLRKGER